MAELIAVVAVILGVSALCSLCEAVLYSVPISHLELLSQSGRPAGRILLRLRQKVDRPIAAILSLNTIANTAGAAVAGALADQVFGYQWVGLFSAGLTLLILLFAEVVPKTAGVVHSQALASWIARPLQMMVWVFRPLIWLCSLSTRLVSRPQKKEGISPEELVTMARLGLSMGTIAQDQVSVIQNILEFESRTAGSIMTPRTVVLSLQANTTAAQALAQVGSQFYSRIPVYDEDQEDIIGLVYRRDILKAISTGREDAQLEELMKGVYFVADILPLDQLLDMFLERHQHLFVVVDGFGGFAGVVTLEDVLEELLGKEIVDEFDQVVDMRALAHRRRDEIIHDRAAGLSAHSGG